MTKKRDKILVFTAIVLMAASLAANILILNNQNKTILEYEGNHLTHLAASIDSNIRSIINARKYAISSVRSDYYILNAEKNWLDSGESDEYVDLLYKGLAESDGIADEVLVIKDGSVALSSAGNTDYDITSYVENWNVKPCVRPDGSLGLIVLDSVDRYGVRIGLLINLENFYREMISSEMAKDNWVLLLDANSQLMIHYQNHKVLADPIDAVSGATCGPDGIEMIKTYQASSQSGSGSYEYWDAVNEVEHSALLTVIPSDKTQSGIFAVGVATDVDEKKHLINMSTVGNAIATVFFMVGIGVLVRNERQARVKMSEAEKELYILREKNKEMEELAQKHRDIAHADRLETIGTLTSSISHEFNNLLTPILADAALALDKISDDDKEMGEYLETIYTSSIKAKRLVSRLSFLSRKSNDNVKIDLPVRSLIARALDSAAPVKPENVEASWNCSEGLNLYADELLLHQMLLNLILNAYQAMEGDGGSLTVSALEQAENIEIRVEDTGKGIPKDIQEKVFDPFFTTKGSGKGTGLGLAICKQVAEDNGGTIRLESEEGTGTSFIITLPKS